MNKQIVIQQIAFPTIIIQVTYVQGATSYNNVMDDSGNLVRDDSGNQVMA